MSNVVEVNSGIVVLHEGKLIAVQVVEVSGTKKKPVYQVADVHGTVFSVEGKQRVKDFYRLCALELMVAKVKSAKGKHFGSRDFLNHSFGKARPTT